ncbi:MAG: phosphate propanoyltransferase [bacterium]|nr:phosphate propanoyltransferase [bacterium]
MQIPLGVSNRHLHLNTSDYQTLFGEQPLIKRNDLSQPGQFAAEQTVSLKTDKGQIDKVRLIGPLRPYTQVEISQTDAYKLGLNPPVRDSGNLDQAAVIEIIGPQGNVTKAAAIIAARHLHLTPADRKRMNLENTNEVKIQLLGEKGAIFDNVRLKVDENYALECHLDTDEANSCLAKTGDWVEILQ